MPADCFLALDAGTSAARCLIVRPGAGPLAIARREWCYDTPPDVAPFGRSFNAEAFWAILCDVTRRALAEAGLSGREIAAVGVTGQRQGLVVIDSDGHSLYAGPNLDARALAEGQAIDARCADRVYASTGKLPSLLMAPARLQWLRSHRPADFHRAAAVLTIGDWLAYHLTGELHAEPSLAGECGLLDITARQRDESLLAELGVPLEILPPLMSCGSVAGEVTPSAARASGLAPDTPVVIAGADTQCALAGMGIGEPGEAGIVAGWSCTVQQATAEPRLDPARRTWAGLHVLPHRWVVESSAADAGHMWRWWCETLLGGERSAHEAGSQLDEAASVAAQAAPGAGDVLALLGPRRMNAGEMGLRLGGLVMTTPLAVGAAGRPQLLRAALENIAYALRANLEQAEEVSGRRAERISLGGGLTRAPVFSRILVDVLNRPIEVAQETEVSAWGTAMLAARAVGSPDGVPPVPAERLDPEPAAVEVYRRQYDRWCRTGEALDRAREELS